MRLYYTKCGEFLLFIGIFVTILEEILDEKGKMVVDGKDYWTQYRKMLNGLCSIKLIDVTQINVP